MGLWIRQGARSVQDVAAASDRRRRAAAVDANDEATGEARSWGCGWFDSSLDLRDGLAVVEHGGLEPLLALELLRLCQARAG